MDGGHTVVYRFCGVSDVHAASCGSDCALVISYKIFKTICLTGITFYTFDNTFPTDGAEIWDIVVHAAVKLRAENTTRMHVSTFIDVHDIAISWVEDKMTPSYLMHFSGCLYVVIPASSLLT